VMQAGQNMMAWLHEDLHRAKFGHPACSLGCISQPTYLPTLSVPRSLSVTTGWCRLQHMRSRKM
jgi:hypothetical protein